MSKPVTRRTGASNEWKHCSCTRCDSPPPPSREPRGLRDHNGPAGRPDLRGHCLVIERHERAKIHHAEFPALVRGLLGRGERNGNTGAIGQQGRVGSAAPDDGTTDRRHLQCQIDLFLAEILLLGFQEDHRVRVSMARRSNPYASALVAGATTVSPGV